MYYLRKYKFNSRIKREIKRAKQRELKHSLNELNDLLDSLLK